MKKTFLTVMLVLTSVLALNAQNLSNLTRTAWSTMVPGDEEMEMVLNFDDDGECYIVLTQETFQDLDDGMSMIIRASLSVPGIYNQEGRDITMSFNKKKADFNLSYELNGADRQTKALFDQFMKSELKKMEPELKQDLLDNVPAFLDDMRVRSVTKSKLILSNSYGDIVEFYPTAKG